MHKDNAAVKADTFISLILQHQTEVLGKQALTQESDGKQVAKVIAALRKELIAQLEQQ